ncbi:spore cortex biosynthesis protein YabQ [Tuberibacillus calidus]|jgi:spore cortex biosynthesis protein YabQ|uniref:spore cortex biosynthesis protein YabQ n=1 Tax=Tuberibacillus calidus TaxID=340097 RepID=UPI00041A5396|nr:spore cortex biosynthesis protein YabQ [Tuberibacillus calidus]
MTLSEQFATMLAMTAMGIWIGASLSAYHRLIDPGKKHRWLRLVTDVLFWVTQGLFIFFILLYLNEGEIRFYLFLALALGFSAYKALFEKPFNYLLEVFIRVIHATIRIINRIFTLFFVQPTLVLLKVLYRFGKMLLKLSFSVLLFVFSAIVLPFKWLIHWLIPKAWINRALNLTEKGRTFLGKWFKKRE